MNTNNLDNNTATPLYLQLKNKLQEDIENGRLAPGSKIPTEFELGEQYGVSRVTVRKALKELSDQGYLERKSGKGTFVAEKKLQRSLSSGVLAFSEMCRSMGLTPGAQTIKIALAELPTESLSFWNSTSFRSPSPSCSARISTTLLFTRSSMRSMESFSITPAK